MVLDWKLNPFDPKIIKVNKLSSDNYIITSVAPTLITNDDLVYVNFYSSRPSASDWIGAYSPPDVDVNVKAPVKFGTCNSQHGSTYLTNGVGQLSFNMTNLRAGIKFYYFTGGTEFPILMNSSSTIVNFENINQPLKNRVVPTGDPNVYQLLWSSANSTSPTLKWGLSSGNYPYIVNASTKTISQSQMCGGPANSSGWRDLGLIHHVNISGILNLDLSNKNLYYIFGDESTDDYSKEITFHVPPKSGTQPSDRPTQVILYGDLGVGSTDSASDTVVWDEECPPAINTTMSVSHLIDIGQVDAIFHSGDISYANGYMATWDFFLDMITPMAGRVLYLTTVGNHESDWPNTAALPYGAASGGECSVCATSLIPMPAPATTNQPWWSYDVGLIHFVGMSTEHDFSVNSVQYNWIQNDLATTNRTNTPWVIFSGHRSMYVDSSECCWSGSDVYVMQQLQNSIEPLLRKYRVNLAWSGHFHDMERQSAIYQNATVQKAQMIYDADGNKVAYHNNPNATVWMIVGSAGNGPSIADRNYSWSEKYWDRTWGYSIVTATNASYLHWQLINSANNEVLDRMVITQDFSPWVVEPTPSSSNNSNGLTSGEVAMVVIFPLLFVGFLIALALYFLYPKYNAKNKPMAKQNEMTQA